jgi:EAL domain-containing protein (putative c-di-GMP-specific phosphodiesterase class I)/DNA-binding NarL/FixJ family response regulator
VLIVDDEQTFTEALRSVLESDPAIDVVGTSATPDEGIELALRTRPDVALVDVRMPDGGAARTAREISHRCPPTRVVALSAFEDRETVLSMIRAGARGFVGKTSSNEEILRAIHGTVDGNAELSAGAMNEVYRAVAERVGAAAPTDEKEQRRKILRIIQRSAVDFVFQPVVDIEAMRIEGVEALARFRTLPRRPPNVWLDHAASLGLVHDLEVTVARVGLRQLERIPAGTYLAVNVSPRLAATPELRELVAAAPPGRLVLELPERATLDDSGGLSGLSDLRAAGVRIAIDDAGAGFSSLRNVVRIAPELIKLDMSVTRDVSTDPTRQALVASYLRFAADIGATLVAKGVETARELEALVHLGVRQAQGYHFARPGRLPEPGRPWGRVAFGEAAGPADLVGAAVSPRAGEGARPAVR